jgi:hypothetical protein
MCMRKYRTTNLPTNKHGYKIYRCSFGGYYVGMFHLRKYKIGHAYNAEILSNNETVYMETDIDLPVGFNVYLELPKNFCIHCRYAIAKVEIEDILATGYESIATGIFSHFVVPSVICKSIKLIEEVSKEELSLW